MDRGLRAQLSPNEETALRKIALEAVDRDCISLPHLEQLVALALIEARDGKWRLTEMGAARLIASGSKHTAVGPSAIHAFPLSVFRRGIRTPLWSAPLRVDRIKPPF